MSSQGTGINTDYYYRLTNTFLGDGRSLDTYSDGANAPFMGNTGNYSGQLWKLTPTGNGHYRLTNTFLGDGRSLDTYSDGANAPFMGNTGNYSGQFWKITPTGNGFYRLTNTFLGEGRSLDTYSNGANAPFMGNTGNYSGQFWKLTPVRLIETAVTQVQTRVQELETARLNQQNAFQQTLAEKERQFQQTLVEKERQFQQALVEKERQFQQALAERERNYYQSLEAQKKAHEEALMAIQNIGENQTKEKILEAIRDAQAKANSAQAAAATAELRLKLANLASSVARTIVTLADEVASAEAAAHDAIEMALQTQKLASDADRLDSGSAAAIAAQQLAQDAQTAASGADKQSKIAAEKANIGRSKLTPLQQVLDDIKPDATPEEIQKAIETVQTGLEKLKGEAGYITEVHKATRAALEMKLKAQSAKDMAIEKAAKAAQEYDNWGAISSLFNFGEEQTSPTSERDASSGTPEEANLAPREIDNWQMIESLFLDKQEVESPVPPSSMPSAASAQV